MNEENPMRPQEWELKEDSLIAHCKVFDVLRRRMRHAGRDTTADFYVVRPANWAIAIAEVSPGRYLLVRQFRYGSKSLSWEFPAGCLEAGEDPVAGAIRELREETGYEGQNPVIIGQSSPNPAIQDNKGWFVLFRNARKVCKPDWDEHEEIECREFSLEEIESMALRGDIHHALAHAALFFLRKVASAAAPR